MRLSEKIKKYRKMFDLSQEQLAEKLNVSRQVVTKWENENGIPEVSNLKALSNLFNVSIDYLLDDEKTIEYPILKDNYEIEKNNYNNRYEFAINYLKKRFGDSSSIYVLTQIENGERNKLTKFLSFVTLGISDISYISEWLGDLAIWFVVEKDTQRFLIKVTKEFIETRELSSLIDINKFSYDKNKFIKVSEV